LHGSVDYISSRRPPSARQRVMRHFRREQVTILIATEIAGMVRLVIVFVDSNKPVSGYGYT
jgi:hypothetical protein